MDDKIYTRFSFRIPKFPLKRQRIPNHPFRKNKYSKFFKAIAVVTIAFTFAYFAIQAIEPIVEKQCRNMAKSIATKISNNEATAAMQNYQYEDLLNITKDENGNVKMVETNIHAVNGIISEVPLKIQEEMEKVENSSFNIPFGSFFGSNLIAGRGPKINIKMELSGNLDTELKSEFINAGINQTLHKIYLEIRCNMVILAPFETIDEQIINQVLLAEGVIVGDVPTSYYNLEGISTENMVDVIE